MEHKSEHFPVLGELYLPEAWTKESKRLKRAGVLRHRFVFKRKWELALELLAQIPLASIPYEAMVLDTGYGEIREFLRQLDKRHQTFVAQIPESHGFWPVDVGVNTQQPKKGRPRCHDEIADKTHVEQGYQQLKEELGLDHFEGRSWRGLHYHVTLCFMAYAFLVLLKSRGLKKTKN